MVVRSASPCPRTASGLAPPAWLQRSACGAGQISAATLWTRGLMLETVPAPLCYFMAPWKMMPSEENHLGARSRGFPGTWRHPATVDSSAGHASTTRVADSMSLRPIASCAGLACSVIA